MGIEKTLNYLAQLEIPTENMPDNLSLSLGSGQLTPMELARGMAVIANGGYDVEPYLIETISDFSGEIIYQAPKTILCDENCNEVAEQAIPETDESDAATPANASQGNEQPPEVRVMPRLADVQRAVDAAIDSLVQRARHIIDICVERYDLRHEDERAL